MRLSVFDLAGRLVRTLVDESRPQAATRPPGTAGTPPAGASARAATRLDWSSAGRSRACGWTCSARWPFRAERIGSAARRWRALPGGGGGTTGRRLSWWPRHRPEPSRPGARPCPPLTVADSRQSCCRPARPVRPPRRGRAAVRDSRSRPAPSGRPATTCRFPRRPRPRASRWWTRSAAGRGRQRGCTWSGGSTTGGLCAPSTCR